MIFIEYIYLKKKIVGKAYIITNVKVPKSGVDLIGEAAVAQEKCWNVSSSWGNNHHPCLPNIFKINHPSKWT